MGEIAGGGARATTNIRSDYRGGAMTRIRALNIGFDLQARRKDEVSKVYTRGGESSNATDDQLRTRRA